MVAEILTVVGARPQFIKAAVVSRALEPYAADLRETLLHTGQHFDRSMSEVFFEELDIPEPAVNLGVNQGTHAQNTAAMLVGIEQEILARQPAGVIVYGDTDSTLAGALAAAKVHVPVLHVEAGLRSFHRGMPEEINRVVTDHLADLLFCPTLTSYEHLEREGIADRAHLVGDTMFDAVMHYRDTAPTPVEGADPYVVATVHRAHSTDSRERLVGIMDGLARCPLPVRLPLHPRTAHALEAMAIDVPPGVEILAPATYLEMIGLITAARFVVTDSGGVQKEAFFLERPCLTLRDETEWTELVTLGANRLVGTDADAIAAGFSWAMEATVPAEPAYGDGRAGEKIAAIIHERLA